MAYVIKKDFMTECSLLYEIEKLLLILFTYSLSPSPLLLFYYLSMTYNHLELKTTIKISP